MKNFEVIKEQFLDNKISWKNSLLNGISLDNNFNPIPWFCYPAISFLETKIKENQKIFEFGCGMSTLYFINKNLKVFSLETNELWYSIMKPLQIRFCKKFLSDSLFYNAVNTDIDQKQKNESRIFFIENPFDNDQYEKFIKNLNLKFDIILIDSLKRFKCAVNAVDHINEDGIIILDDSERKNYSKIFNFFNEKKFKNKTFSGIAPGQLKIKNTTFFYR